MRLRGHPPGVPGRTAGRPRVAANQCPLPPNSARAIADGGGNGQSATPTLARDLALAWRLTGTDVDHLRCCSTTFRYRNEKSRALRRPVNLCPVSRVHPLTEHLVSRSREQWHIAEEALFTLDGSPSSTMAPKASPRLGCALTNADPCARNFRHSLGLRYSAMSGTTLLSSSSKC